MSVSVGAVWLWDTCGCHSNGDCGWDGADGVVSAVGGAHQAGGIQRTVKPVKVAASTSGMHYHRPRGAASRV